MVDGNGLLHPRGKSSFQSSKNKCLLSLNNLLYLCLGGAIPLGYRLYEIIVVLPSFYLCNLMLIFTLRDAYFIFRVAKKI